MSPTLHEIQEASERLASYVLKTPIVTNDSLNDSLNCTVFWKLENFQHTSAFKVRGAFNRILNLSPGQTRRGIVAASSGNHGIGVSFAAKTIGIPAIIFMPVSTPTIKQQKAKQYGARIVQHGHNYQEALVVAQEHARLNSLPFISSFDDQDVIAGQGTIVPEILEQVGNVDDLVVPVGGGGLAAGSGIALKALRPSARMYGVQPKAASCCYDSCLAGKQVTVPPGETLADGLVCTKPGDITFPIIQQTISDILLVDELSITEALKLLINTLDVILEPAAAVCLAAVKAHREIFWNRRVACVLTGGNIDQRLLDQVLKG